MIEDKTIELKVNFAGIKLKNPVLVASGTFGCGEEYSKLIDLNQLGGIITKSITEKPCKGNPAPRLAETPAGMLNAIGLENKGVDDFIKEKIPFLKKFMTALIVNIAGFNEDEYVRLSERLDTVDGVDGIEVNLSCPNVKKGGIHFGSDPVIFARLVKRIRSTTKRPLIIKLSPNVGDVVLFAEIARDNGANGVSLINTLLGLSIDVHSRRPKLANVTGGLSGPAIRPVALRMVWEVFQHVKMPILGGGGILKTEDALEFFITGANAVTVGTANFVNPGASLEIIDGLREYLEINKFKSINDIVGSLEITQN